jgi:DNA-directed RNA polymerase specialized sigma24 family protein
MEWFCPPHAVERRDAAEAGARETAALRAVNEEVRAALALLPPEVQRELHEQAMGGLLVRRAGDMMYWWNLRRALQAYEIRISGDGFFL